MYLINMLLTNGDVSATPYTKARALEQFAKLMGNPLVVYASLHDENDTEIAVIDHTQRD